MDGLLSIGTQYDGVGNITQTTETYSAAPSRIHTRVYDTFNRLQSETDPWNDTITHVYDAQGNRTRTTAQGGTTIYGYDVLNRRISITAAGGPIGLGFDRTNLPTTVTYPNGLATTTAYDAAMRVKSVATMKVGGSTLESFAYTYDANSNRFTQTRTAGSVTEATTYLYDNDDWLTQTSLNRSDGTTSSTQIVNYTLDAVGNRTVENSSGTGAFLTSATYSKSYTLDPRDRVTQLATTGAGAGTATYTYDANGNLTTKSNSSGSMTYVWNARDRLVQVVNGTLPVAQYAYNAEGLRDEIVGQRRTTWVNGFAYLDKTPGNALLAKYETQPNGRSPVAEITSAGTEYLHIDALGSSTLETNAAGTTAATTTYDAFGNSVVSGAPTSKFGYTGHEPDQATGFIYFKARFYDPELGKFIGADEYEGDLGLPISWNAYLYANANPLIFVDLQGYYSWDEFKSDAKDFGKGVAKGAGKVVYEALATTYDVEQVVYSTGKAWATGKVEDVQYASAIGQAAAGGAGTGDILKGGALAAVQTPGRLGSAIGTGNAEAAGEEAFNLALLLAPGAKTGVGAVRNVASGLRAEGVAAVKTAATTGVADAKAAVISTAEDIKVKVENVVDRAKSAVSEVRAKLTTEGAKLDTEPAGFTEKSAPAKSGASEELALRIQRNIAESKAARDASRIDEHFDYEEAGPVGEIAPNSSAGAMRAKGSLYRYVGEGEAEVIRKTGEIPNVDRAGNPKDVYVTDRLYETRGRAQTYLQLPARPKYRVKIDPADVPGRGPMRRVDPSANPGWGRGGGTESFTRDTIKVDPATLTPLRGPD